MTKADQKRKEVTLTRVFDAPRELVFKAWIDPQLMAQWWGPNEFTNPVCELDVRPGGAIRVDMRGPDGTVYPMKGVFHEIVKPERLVFTSTAIEDKEGKPQLEVLTTVTFAEQDGKTKLRVQAVVVKAGQEASAALDGMEEGWRQTLDRLGVHMSTADREITATRVFDASRDVVFRMWTDPNYMAQWWGPNGFTNTIDEMDVRPGGVWRFVMHGPDGVDYQNKIIYDEIVKPELIAYSHVSGPQFHVTVTFTEQDNKTKVTLRMLFESAEARENVVKKYGAVDGLNQTLGHLEEQLAKRHEFILTRVFDAPRDLVWEAFAESDRLGKWWGPKGFTMRVAKLDFCPGGVFHYSMNSPDGHDMWGKFVYREIIKPERIVFVNSFSDEQGNTIRAPFSPAWPLEVQSTVIFSEHDGKTTLTLRGVPINATEEERKTFKAGHQSMQQGFKGTLDQLADYLART